MHELYELKEKLMDELKEYGSQEMSAGSLEVIDKLAHAIKNICKIIDGYEEDGYSQEGGMYRRGSSYARGRSRTARRDAMGRYSRAEDDMADMIEELRGMMHNLSPEKQTEVKKFITKIEQM